MSRPTTFTEPTVQKLEQAFRDGFNVVEACRTSGVSRAAYYQHLADDVEFMDKMRTAQDYVNIKAKHVIIEKILKEGDATAARWWLERRAKDEFGSKSLSNLELDERDQFVEAAHTSADPLTESVALMKHLVDIAIVEAEEQQSKTTEASRAPSRSLIPHVTHHDGKNYNEPSVSIVKSGKSRPSIYDTRFDVMNDLYN